MKLTIFSILFLISTVIFSQTVFVPNSGNINTTPNGHTLVKVNRSANVLYVSFDKYYTGNNSEYPTNYPGTEYYVSSSTGSDSNNGLTKATPFATISKINALSTAGEFGGGDAILFQSTGGWEETLTISNSGTATNPLTIGAYGINTSKPKIYGSKVITGWTQRKAGIPIYATKYSTADITQLFIDGDKMKVARYPNIGYHLITTVVSTSQITMSGMASEGADFYLNAKVLVRPLAFSTDIRTVAISTGNTLTLNSAVTGIETGEGIVLINKLSFLDEAGEWFYDTATDSLYLWKYDSSPVTDTEVRGSILTNGVYMSSKNYVTVKDLDILQQKSNGVFITGVCSNIKIQDNTITGPESYGISAENTSTGGTRLEYSGNTISDCNAGGIYAYRNDTSIVRDNVVTDIGLFERLGILGTTVFDRGFGIYINGRGNQITYNRLDSIGYHGIYWNSYTGYYGASTISYNLVKNSGVLKSDVGGIYTGGNSTSGSVISYNIVDGCLGIKTGSKDSRNFGQGIYLDEPATTITAEYNTLINNSDGGINLHDGTSHTIRRNTIYNNRQSFIMNDTVNSAVSSITYNLAITGATTDYEPRQLATNYYNDYNMDTWNYNTYVNGYASDLVFKVVTPFGYNAFAAWQTYTGGEAGSTYIGTDLAVGEEQRVVYNTNKTATTFYLNGATANDENGTSITTSFVLQPFTSKYVRGTYLTNIVDHVETFYTD
jgi:parallel beta-helix repeat protein